MLSRRRVDATVTSDQTVLVADDTAEGAELGREVVTMERLLTAVTGRTRDVAVAPTLTA